MGTHEKSKAVNGIIVNSTVTMEWKSANWLESKSGIFYLAGQEYNTPNGGVMVFFIPDRAFIFTDNPDDLTDRGSLWNFSNMKSYAKSAFAGEVDPDFPEYHECYFPIAIIDGTVIESTAATLGLTEFLPDIQKRLDDISSFGEEIEVQL